MKYLGKEIPPLTTMDVSVVEIIEHDSKRHGSFLYHFIQALAAADSANLETLRTGFPKIVQSFERWKSGEAGYLYDLSQPGKSHLRIVK